MNKTQVLIIIMCIGCVFIGAVTCFAAYPQGSLPVPDKNGDYISGTRSQVYWIVVDTDYNNGLNGRLAANFPRNWEDINAKWPEDKNIGAWPVVARFHHGSVLNAARGNAGIIMQKDENNKPWIMMQIDAERVCFVRANSKYIKPVRIED